MLYKLTETVIEYHPDDLDAWKRGEKHKWLDGRIVPPEVYNQPRYHFGEYFVMNFFEKARWHGYCFYSFSESRLEKLQEGQNKIAELFPSDRLTAFRDVRSRSKYPEGKGEPDLFLYMDNGPKLFLEVKKESDRVSAAQLECLAQIRGILKAEIGIIYLVKHSHQHTSKAFELDLETFQCLQRVVA
jgi:hypothetical protein